MQVNTRKYKVLFFLNLVLFLFGIYGCNGHKLHLSNFLFSILFLSIIYYLIKIYKDENTAIELAQAKSKALINISHELRTPLNSVVGFSEQLGQSKLDDKQIEQLTAIRNSSGMLLDLVNDILDFSTYETDKVNFDKLPFLPHHVLQEVVSNLHVQAKQKGISLAAEISFKDNVCVLGDSLRLKQVVINLLSNAIKFTEKGSVTLYADVASPSENQCLLNINIVDTGIGIDAKNLEIIFDEFAQIKELSSSPIINKGTGLGLAICKKIIELQNGKMSVESILGTGSIFSFSIPFKLCDQMVVKHNSQPSRKISNHFGGKRILIVDDNKMNVLLAQTVVAKYNIAVDIAYSGIEATNLFEKNNYDLLLTDIHMPGINGIELSKIIRSHCNLAKRKTSILGVTADVLITDKALCLEAGMNDVVLKPYTERGLMEKIALLINH